MMALPEGKKKFQDRFSRLDTIPGVTDGWTDGWTRCRSKDRASRASRG